MARKTTTSSNAAPSSGNDRSAIREEAGKKKAELSATIADNVSQNLRKLIQYLDWSQAKMANALDVSEAAVSGYLRGAVIPSPETLALITQIAASRKNLRFSVDELMFENLQFDLAQNKSHEYVTEKEKHADYIGNYYLYFFDQSNAGAATSINSARRLRYGVISIYQEMRRIGEYGVYTCAKFFKEASDAGKFREALDSIVTDAEDEKRSKTLELYSGDKETYVGEIAFNDNHVFVELNSGYFGDKALAVFYAPHKKADSSYIGGLGSMVSVSHGSPKMPVAQKVILSDVELKASPEKIAYLLRMEPLDIPLNEEVDSLYATYQMLSQGSKGELSISQFLDDEDIEAIVRSRLKHLIRSCVDKNLNAVCSITEAEDAKVYQLIKKSVFRGQLNSFIT